jgi:hypothetical protein
MFAVTQAADEVKNIHPAPRADHAVQPWHFLHQIRAVPLRQAAGGDHHLVFTLAVGQFAQGVNRFLLGGVNKAAGIDDQYFGLIRVANAAHPVLVEHLRDAFRVHRIF